MLMLCRSPRSVSAVGAVRRGELVEKTDRRFFLRNPGQKPAGSRNLQDRSIPFVVLVHHPCIGGQLGEQSPVADMSVDLRFNVLPAATAPDEALRV